MARRLGMAIAALAARQHGVVARVQLLALGAGPDAIEGWVASGRLHPLYRGVYAVGHRVLTVRGWWMAAVLACGRGAVLSHRSAAAAWDLRGYAGIVEVTTGRYLEQPRIRTYQSELPADEITTHEAIPVTTVARTLLDLAAVLDRDRLAHAVGKAERRLLADSPSLPDLVARHRGRRGLATLRAVLAERRIGIDVPASELEIEFQTFLRERGLPRPEVNAWIEAGGRMFEIDCLWRAEGLAVELDSRAHHDDGESFESDRARDMVLLAAGLRTARVTSRRLRLAPDALERELRAALAA